MTKAANPTRPHSTLATPAWPNEPEDLLKFIPNDLAGSPFEMLMCVLIRARGVIALLTSEFMGDGDFRPDDQEIVGALWTAQNQLQLARELLERLETIERQETSEHIEKEEKLPSA